jgi:glycosyltransferase involved in cell wall biosynthesis
MPEASLIVSTFNQPRQLVAVLRQLDRQTTPPARVVIADDGSDEATTQMIAALADKLSFPITHVWQQHAGFRKTIILNEAIAHTDSDYLIFLDGDCIPTRRFVADHIALAEDGTFVQGRRAFIAESAVPAYLDEKHSIPSLILRGRVSGLSKAIRLPRPVIRRDVGQRGLIGCNLGLWRQDLIAINGFDESFTGWGGEDSDLGNRLYNLGKQRKFVYGRAIVYHLNHPKLSREKFPANLEKLQQTREQKLIRCPIGLANHPGRDFRIQSW